MEPTKNTVIEEMLFLTFFYKVSNREGRSEHVRRVKTICVVAKTK